MRSSKSGSALGVTLVFAIAISAVLAGLLGSVNTESRVARRSLLQTKAEYGAEAAAEYALAQMRCVLQQRPSFAPSLFTGSGAITVPNTAVLGSTGSSVLTGVTGSGPNGYATSIASSLATLQNNAASSTARFRVTGATINVGNFSSEATVLFDPANALYVDDPLRGQRVRTRRVKVLAAATATDTERNETHTAYCEEILQVRDTALFNFISFYNMDLEVAPLPAMALVGAIHTNRDFYVGSMNSVDFYDVVTSAGVVKHGTPNGISMTLNGSVSFKGADGTQQSMKDSSNVWIDSNYATWKSTALSRWGGNLLNKDHGITATVPATVPAYVPDNPATSAYDPVNDAHDLIEPSVTYGASNYPGDDAEAAKLANQACLVITVSRSISGSGSSIAATPTVRMYKYTASATGSYVRPTASGTARYNRTELTVPTGMITHRRFYDRRQAEYVFSADIDVGVLKTAVEVPGVSLLMTNGTTTFNPTTEWNGIVYVEDANPATSSSNAMGAVRLVNGRYLPSKPTASNSYAAGMTLATNSALYIVGNYNADGTLPTNPQDIVNTETGEVPAAVAADAVTVLSNAWTVGSGSTTFDSKSDDNNLSLLPASQTEIATAVMTGLVPSNKQNNGVWSGAINNIVRYLEDWNTSGQKKFGLRGNVTVLYESEVANKVWSSTAYDPPNRLFGLSQNFTDGSFPPGAPRARSYRRLLSRQLSPAEYQASLASIDTN